MKSVRHPRLYLRPRGGIAQGLTYDVRRAHPVTEPDVALCERLIDAYAAALDGQAGDRRSDGMWSWIYETRQRRLGEVLAARDANGLAVELASMFQSTFVMGMAPGSLIAHSRSRLGGRIWRAKAVDGLVSLAEALGVVAVQDAEQGRGDRVLDIGLPRLVAQVEGALGYAIDFPDIGAAHGVHVGGRLLTIDSTEQIYAAVRIEQALRLHLSADAARSPRIVEIGGGYGSTGYWLLRGAIEPSRYTIVDFPIVGVLQGYFLSKALGASEVSLHGEPPARVVLVPNTALADVQTPYEVLVNKDSMPEMPPAAVHAYLAWARDSCRGFLYSYNQESTSELLGERQGRMQQLVEEMSGFSRLRRDQSWVRTGYVEEIYVPVAETT